MLVPAVGQDIYDVGQSIAGLGKLTNPRYGLWERPERERERERENGKDLRERERERERGDFQNPKGYSNLL